VQVDALRADKSVSRSRAVPAGDQTNFSACAAATKVPVPGEKLHPLNTGILPPSKRDVPRGLATSGSASLAISGSASLATGGSASLTVIGSEASSTTLYSQSAGRSQRSEGLTDSPEWRIYESSCFEPSFETAPRTRALASQGPPGLGIPTVASMESPGMLHVEACHVDPCHVVPCHVDPARPQLVRMQDVAEQRMAAGFGRGSVTNVPQREAGAQAGGGVTWRTRSNQLFEVSDAEVWLCDPASVLS
jgi:hypothetical protein